MDADLSQASRRESLRRRVKIARETCRVYCSLHGCPTGGWGETAQARSEIADALPFRAERAYTVDDLIDALYVVDATGRYRWRDWPAEEGGR